MSTEPSVIRIKPHYYCHILDNNSNVTRVEVGPQTFTRQEHEKIILGPESMVIIPPRNYCTISNPVFRDNKGEVVLEKNGQVKLRHGDNEIRFEQEPFPLFPGENLKGEVKPLQVVLPNEALRIKASRDFTDNEGNSRKAGDEWMFEGPKTYVPRIEENVLEIVNSVIIKPNQALKIRAKRETIDKIDGSKRAAGEEWLIKLTGSYLPGVDEEVLEKIDAVVLTDKKALHLQATKTFTDVFKKLRKAGEEWLVSNEDTDTYIPDVYENIIRKVKVTTLNNGQYCVVVNPWKGEKQFFKQRELRKGEASFFLKPGESLEDGIQEVYILSQEEALLLKVNQTFFDSSFEKERYSGERFMVYGPRDYVPPVEVEVIEKRTSIPLDENEGIYVRDIKTGNIRAVTNESYMLKASEELWEKELPKIVEEILSKERNENFSTRRDKTRVVTYHAPHNSAVQIYDYKEKKSRVVFGPELIMLGPDEQFTVASLSGDIPKKPFVIKTIAILLGPDFMTDIVIVETADHARLSLKLSYSWHFDLEKSNLEDSKKLFQVRDFVGDSCKTIASRVRGAVASVSFDFFHRNSANIIRSAVFGVDENDKICSKLKFTSNNLIITNIDIQSVEPVDQRTRDSLQKSVQLAIEITTKSQEASAKHESARLEQESIGKLERQKIVDEAALEKERKRFIELKAQTSAVESTGKATAEAKAKAEAANIEGEAAVKQAQLSAEATKIKYEAELFQLKLKKEAEIAHKRALNELEITRSRKLADIEAAKFKEIVDSIGADTIKSMSEAGPAMQAKLLQGLGLKSFLITDGNSPINLFNTASGLIGGLPDKK